VAEVAAAAAAVAEEAAAAVAVAADLVATGLAAAVADRGATGLVAVVVAGIIDLLSLGSQRQRALLLLSLITKVLQIFLMHKVISIHKLPTSIRMLLGM
jgi:hypothetical protein